MLVNRPRVTPKAIFVNDTNKNVYLFSDLKSHSLNPISLIGKTNITNGLSRTLSEWHQKEGNQKLLEGPKRSEPSHCGNLAVARYQ